MDGGIKGGGGGQSKRTGQSGAHRLGVLARPPQGLDLELGALELADAHFVVDDGVKGCAVALPSCRHGGGEERWEVCAENAPRGWAEGSLEGVHLDVFGGWTELGGSSGNSNDISYARWGVCLCIVHVLTNGWVVYMVSTRIASRVRCRHRLPRPV